MAKALNEATHYILQSTALFLSNNGTINNEIIGFF